LAELDIPKSDRDGLAIWRDMPEASLNSFLLEIEQSSAPPSLPSISGSDIKLALDALNTMYTIRAFNSVSTDAFIDDVCEALTEANQLSPSQEKGFRERLQRLLDIDQLKTAAKAANLHTEHERLLCFSRVITDARPVYGKSASDAPEAMIITHELKLTYHEGPSGSLQEVYIGLGPNEIAHLKEQLTRAEEKTKSLREIFGSSKIRFIDPTQKH
jgi:hypothetical protein